MDYSHFGNNPDKRAVASNFDNISNVLTAKLGQFQKQNFRLNQFYMFGNGFGGQVVLQAGRKIGRKSVYQIDGKNLIFVLYFFCSI